MCFSAGASLAAGAVISSMGVATILKVEKPSQVVFASIPLCFGVQQFAEGVLWLAIPRPEFVLAKDISSYVFLVLAQVLWPVMVPLSVLLMEENPRRKRALWMLLAPGFLSAICSAYCLLFYNVDPRIVGFHIKYYNNIPRPLANAAFVVYLSATIAPFFVSSIKMMNLLGALMFLSCLVAAIIFFQHLTSVWCFFAALISGVIYWILIDVNRRARLQAYPS